MLDDDAVIISSQPNQTERSVREGAFAKKKDKKEGVRVRYCRSLYDAAAIRRIAVRELVVKKN